jgi:ubiquitin carboxyl-terminal hydrolase 5/13
MNKVAHGMLSGRYAVSRCENRARDGSGDTAPTVKSFQEGIKPMMFKAFVGKGHPEFSTMRQQDADEFMRYLFQFIQRQARQSLAKTSLLSTLTENDLDPTLPFRFELEEKLQCTSCQCVRYRYEEQEALSLPVPAVPVTPPTEPDLVGITPSGQTTYQPVSLEDCLQSFTTPQSVEYNCPRCKSKTTALTLVIISYDSSH